MTNAAAIGQILPCPKCGSMVQVVPPLSDSIVVQEDQGAHVASGGTAEVAFTFPAGEGIEQIAEQVAAMLPDVGGARPTPPPLPDDGAALPVASITGVARPSAAFVASSAVAILAVLAMAWGAWSFFQGDEPDTTVAKVEQPRADEEPQAAVPGGPPDGQPRSEAAAPAQDTEDHATRAHEGAQEVPSFSEPSDAVAAGSNADVIELSNTQNALPPVQATIAATPSGRSNQPAAAQSGADSNIAPAEVSPSGEGRLARRPSLELRELPPPHVPATQTVEPQSAGQQAVAPDNAIEAQAPAAPHIHDAPVDAAVPSADPPLRRVAPTQVDVASRLSTTIAAVELRNSPLHCVLDTISELAGVGVSLNLDAVRAAGVRVDHAVSVEGQSLTIAAALAQSLGPLRLEAEIENGQLVVVPQGAAQVRKARYAVDDLVRRGDPPMEELVAMAGAILRAGDDDAQSPLLSAQKGAIEVSATAVAHDRMIELCEKMRVARGRPLRSRFDAARPDPRFDPRRFELATRRSRSSEMFAQPITAGVGQAAPLSEIVDYLAEQTGAMILIDRPALAAAGMADNTEARLVSAGETLDIALRRLLEPLELTYRAVDDKLIEITTPQAVAQRADIEFYPLRGQRNGDVNSDEDFGKMAEELLAAAGVKNSQAVVWFDPPSRCLVVSAPYPVQTRLEDAVRKMAP